MTVAASTPIELIRGVYASLDERFEIQLRLGCVSIDQLGPASEPVAFAKGEPPSV